MGTTGVNTPSSWVPVVCGSYSDQYRGLVQYSFNLIYKDGTVGCAFTQHPGKINFKGGFSMANTSKPLTKRIIFLLAAAILYLMIPQNATMPMPEEAVFPFSLLSLSQIARVFAFRQWIAMDLILFTAVLVIMQLIRGKHEGGMFLRNKTARIICMAAFLVVFLPLAYITIPTVFILGKPAFMSMDAWVFMFGKQGANQNILHLWWAASAVLLDMGIAK